MMRLINSRYNKLSKGMLSVTKEICNKIPNHTPSDDTCSLILLLFVFEAGISPPCTLDGKS